MATSAASMQDATSQQSSRQYENLKGSLVYQVAEQRKTDITELWGDNDISVIFWARSMGCFFCQELARELKSDVLPKLQAEGIKSFLVSIGSPERGLEFAELTSFPSENLLADPENVTYDALGLTRNTLDTYFNPRTPLAIAERVRKDGAKVLREALSTWKPWIPPGKGQAEQQGGCFIFKGKECVYEYKDPATGRHVNIDEVRAQHCSLCDVNHASLILDGVYR
ncbi:g12279 [Coccomyxa viridis]|uniref:G12279 protein n=1 Tax=Coccomyxa viridis TaxID=1274662 RepID=A0ABP1GAB1_9CHLO